MNTIRISTVQQLHDLLGLPSPSNKYVSVIPTETIRYQSMQPFTLEMDLYFIILKPNVNYTTKYGYQYFTFDTGVLGAAKPNQPFFIHPKKSMNTSGYWLVFHPHFLLNDPLMEKIQSYEFFSYNITEALQLVKEEEDFMVGIMGKIEKEYQEYNDKYSPSIMSTLLDLFLQYTNRFYIRQYREKQTNNELILQFFEVLDNYFLTKSNRNKLPTVKGLSDKLHVSPNYLSHVLKKNTSCSAKKHIENKLTSIAMQYLTHSNYSVQHLAYHLGFEHPQSFIKFFKRQTSLTPNQFRKTKIS